MPSDKLFPMSGDLRELMRLEKEKRVLPKAPAKRATPDVVTSMIDYDSSSSDESDIEVDEVDQPNESIQVRNIFDPALNTITANLLSDRTAKPADQRTSVPDAFFDIKDTAPDDFDLLRDLNREIQQSEMLTNDIDDVIDPSSLFEGLEERRAHLTRFKADLKRIRPEAPLSPAKDESDTSSDDELQWRVKVLK